MEVLGMRKGKIGTYQVYCIEVVIKNRTKTEMRTYYFTQGGGEHVSDRCHMWSCARSTSIEKRLGALVGDKESSS